jgi:predicted phosphoribosyltransferase
MKSWRWVQSRAAASSFLTQGSLLPLRLPPAEVARIAERERQELERRQRLYRDHRPYPKIAGKIVR